MQRLMFLLMLTQSCADNPAFKALLSEKALTDLSQMMPVWIQSKMKSTAIPDIHDQVDIGIGWVNYVLSQMRVVQCETAEPSLVFVEGTGLYLEVRELSLAVSGRWRTKFGIITDSGSFDVEVYNIYIRVVLGVGDKDGHLSISSESCSNDVGNVYIQFHGGTSFFYQLFEDYFSGKASDMIRQKICPAIQQAVTNMETILQERTVNIPVDKYVYLSAPLTSAPAVTDQSCRLEVKAEFYSRRSPSEPPFSARAFDLQYSDKHMLTLAASQFTVNSAAFAYLRSGALQTNITDDMIPKGSPLHLNTSQFGVFIPQLRTLYPDMKMQVLLYASDMPLFSFTSGLMNIHVKMAAKFSAVKADDALVPLFTLNVDSRFSGIAQISNQKLTGALKVNNITLTVGSSEIGDFKTDTIKQVLVIAVNTIILPKLNARLRSGFLLPTLQGFSLSNSQLLIKNGFVVIFTDIRLPDGLNAP